MLLLLLLLLLLEHHFPRLPQRPTQATQRKAV
jgi:hypothetical protein